MYLYLPDSTVCPVLIDAPFDESGPPYLPVLLYHPNVPGLRSWEPDLGPVSDGPTSISWNILPKSTALDLSVFSVSVDTTTLK